MDTSTLRPGLLVSMKTTIEGNVSYRKKDIERPHRTEEGQQRAKWETVRTIADPVEHEAAVKTRSKIRNLIAGTCAASAFGLLCPDSDVKALELAIVKGREIAEEFNSNSTISKVNLYIITGRIAPDDAEAIRAINSEVADLIKTMQDGLKSLDVKAVREAANKARSIGAMLSGEASDKVAEAISLARKAARDLVKAGEQAAVAVDGAILQSLTEARTAFLDVGEAKAVEAPEAVAERALDLTPLQGPDGETIPSAGGELPSTAELRSDTPALDRALDSMPDLELESH